MPDASIEELTRGILSFRDAREWKQSHNPKDVAISLVLEVSEVLDLFQLQKEADSQDQLDTIRPYLALFPG